MDTIKSWDRPTIEAAAGSAGAKCKLDYSFLRGWWSRRGDEEMLMVNRYCAAGAVGCVCAYGWEDCDGGESGECAGYGGGGGGGV